MSLLHGQAAVVTAAIETLGVGGALEVLLHREQLVQSRSVAVSAHLVDAVPESLRDPAHNGPPHLTGGHLSQLYGSGLAVECSVRRHDQIGGVF